MSTKTYKQCQFEYIKQLQRIKQQKQENCARDSNLCYSNYSTLKQPNTISTNRKVTPIYYVVPSATVVMTQ